MDMIGNVTPLYNKQQKMCVLPKANGNYSAAENYRNITLRAVMIFYGEFVK
jgi:hypothetical protein